MNKDNSEIKKILEAGINNHEKNQLFEASKYYLEILELENDNFEANFYLGIIYAQQKKFGDAEKQFIKSTKIKPDVPDLYNNLGLIYKELKDFKKSLSNFKEALRLNSKFAIAHNNIALVYRDIGQIDEAEKNFLKAIEIEPNYLDSYNNLGILYKDISKTKHAKELFLKVLKNNPKKLVSLINLSNLLKNIGETSESEKYLLRAIEINVKYFPAYNNLMVLYERTNQNEKLKDIINKTTIYFSEKPVVRLFYGHYLYKIGSFKDAVSCLKKIVFDKDQFKEEKLRNFLLAKNYDKIDDIDNAFKHFQITNDLSLSLKNKDVDKEKALKLITNRIKFFENHDVNLAIKNNSTKQTLNPIFLIGFPRSGTTLLDTILRSHPEIEILEEKPAMTEILNELQNITYGDLNNLNNISQNQINLLQNNYINKLNSYNNKSAKIIIDKMPLNIVHVGEIIKIFPNAKFIFALRHPCDCVLSCFMQNFKLNNSMANFLNINDTANKYDLVMKLWTIYTESFKFKYKEIKYENVVSNFNDTIDKLLEFLGLEWSDNVLEFYKTGQNRNLISTPSYDQVNKPIYLDSTNKWKNYENKIQKILPILNPWIKKFGY